MKKGDHKKRHEDLDETQETLARFREVVNMTPHELEEWLKTDASKEVGYRSEGRESDESVGHHSGRLITKLLKKGDQASYSAAELAHMKKVVGYVHRHGAQRPKGNVHDTPWRYSLMNWGHDPEKHR